MKSNPERKLVKNYARAFAPATVSNIGPGFDLMGFPLFDLGDIVEVTVNDLSCSRITDIVGNTTLSKELEKNTAGAAVKSFLDKHAPGEFVDIVLHKLLPIGSGLGSSAASAVAAVVAVNALLSKPLEIKDLVEHALDGEVVASGTRHGDNVIPSLVGGVVVISDPVHFKYFKFDAPEDLIVLTLHPHVEIKTSEARAMLPKMVSVSDSIKQTAGAVTLITGMIKGDYSLLKAASSDFIAEPFRSKLIPGYNEIKFLASSSEAIAMNISGSGPTSFVFFRTLEDAKLFIPKIQKVYDKIGLGIDINISKINNTGAQILEVR